MTSKQCSITLVQTIFATFSYPTNLHVMFRSVLQELLVVLRHSTKTMAARALSVAGPKLWYELPLHIRKSQSTDQFKTLLKMHLFIPNTFVGLVGKVRKNYLPKEEGRVEKKSVCSMPAGPGARTRDLSHARRGSGAARQGGCLDKQAFPCL